MAKSAKTKVDDRELGIARVYAQSMLHLAEETGQGDSLLEELSGLVDYLDQNTDFATFLSSPLVEEEARERTLEKVLRGRATDLLVDSLLVINRKGRLGLLRAIGEAYRTEHRDLRGIVDTRVRTAVPLSEALREQLVAAVAGYTGKQPHLEVSVDPALIGGMIIEVAGKKIDTSLASQLKKLGGTLLQRASQEIYSGRTYVE